MKQLISNLLLSVLFLVGSATALEKWDFTTIRSPEKGLLSDRVKSVAVKDSLLFAATARGVCFMNLLRDYSGILEPSMLPKGILYDLCFAGDSLWIAASGGIGAVNIRTGAADTVPSSVSGITSRSKCVASFGDEVWFGTDIQGAFCYNRRTGTWKRLSRNSGLISDNINAILPTADSVWFGSAENGLSLFLTQRNSFVHFNRYDGLSSNTINRIIRGYGNIFFCTPYGLTVYNQKQDDFKSYLQSNGLHDNLILTAALDGRYLWMAGMGGLSRLDLSDGKIMSLNKNDGVPDEFINDCAIFGDKLILATDGKGLCLLDKKTPEVRIDRTEYVDKKIRLYGTLFAGNKKISCQWRYHNALFPAVELNTGFTVTTTHTLDGLLAVWDLKDILDGNYVVQLSATQDKGFSNNCLFPLNTDTFDPELTLDELPLYTSRADLAVKGGFSEKNVSKILLYPNGSEAMLDQNARRFVGTVTLEEGHNLVKAVITDLNGRTMEARRTIFFNRKSVLFDMATLPGKTNRKLLPFSGTLRSSLPVRTLACYPAPALFQFDTLTLAFQGELSLGHEGDNLFILKAEDASGTVSSMKLSVTLDTKGPAFVMKDLPLFTPDSLVAIQGTVDDAAVHDATLMPGGESFHIDSIARTFHITRRLLNGLNDFVLSAIDSCGNVGQITFTVVRDLTPPVFVPPTVPELIRERYYLLEGRFIEDHIESVTAEPGAFQASLDLKRYTYSLRLTLSNGPNTFNLTARDKAGNITVLPLTLTARFGESDKAIMILREQIVGLNQELDSLKRKTGNGPSAVMVNEIVTLKREIRRLETDKEHQDQKLRRLKQTLAQKGKINTQAMAEVLADSAAQNEPPSRLIYLTRPGEQLTDIALRFYGDAEKALLLAQYNRLTPGDNLPAGTRLIVPMPVELFIAPGPEEKTR
ncbi:MAG: hypothetical protein A2293_08800 [Elusimicrobia bacterium RIFOXYB2_FULL_49_7]|nr:MAG: hypothetical protein A2293_08800 [Elusimicrobia bacterium RIFOXYB2_FULL_49_7]